MWLREPVVVPRFQVFWVKIKNGGIYFSVDDFLYIPVRFSFARHKTLPSMHCNLFRGALKRTRQSCGLVRVGCTASVCVPAPVRTLAGQRTVFHSNLLAR